MEEVNLRGVKTSWTCWTSEVNGSKSSDSGFGWDFVGFEFVLKFVDWSVSEDQSDFILEERSEILKLGNKSSVALSEVLEFVLFDAFGSHFNDLLGQSVLIDDEMGTICSEGLPDLVDLTGTHIGEVGENDLFMIAE